MKNKRTPPSRVPGVLALYVGDPQTDTHSPCDSAHEFQSPHKEQSFSHSVYLDTDKEGRML